jgi:hypothetical protein
MSSEPYRLSLWNCSEAPLDIRLLLPKNCNQGWVAHLSREMVDGPLLTFFRQAASRARSYFLVILPDGSALFAACGAEVEYPT